MSIVAAADTYRTARGVSRGSCSERGDSWGRRSCWWVEDVKVVVINWHRGTVRKHRLLFPTALSCWARARNVSTYTFSPTCPTRTSTRCVRVKSSAFAWGAIAFSVQETIFHIYLLHFDHVLTTCYPTSSCDLCQLIKIGTVGTPFLYSTHPSAVTSFECYKPLQS